MTASAKDSDGGSPSGDRFIRPDWPAPAVVRALITTRHDGVSAAPFDGFNLGNSHASETISRATGPQYLKPSAILAPRTFRVGFRFIF